MSVRERVARSWHEGSDHAKDGTPFGGPLCNCWQVAGRIMPMLAEAKAAALREAADAEAPDFHIEVALGGGDYVRAWLHDRADQIETEEDDRMTYRAVFTSGDRIVYGLVKADLEGAVEDGKIKPGSAWNTHYESRTHHGEWARI